LEEVGVGAVRLSELEGEVFVVDDEVSWGGGDGEESFFAVGVESGSGVEDGSPGGEEVVVFSGEEETSGGEFLGGERLDEEPVGVGLEVLGVCWSWILGSGHEGSLGMRALQTEQ